MRIVVSSLAEIVHDPVIKCSMSSSVMYLFPLSLLIEIAPSKKNKFFNYFSNHKSGKHNKKNLPKTSLKYWHTKLKLIFAITSIAALVFDSIRNSAIKFAGVTGSR